MRSSGPLQRLRGGPSRANPAVGVRIQTTRIDRVLLRKAVPRTRAARGRWASRCRSRCGGAQSPDSELGRGGPGGRAIVGTSSTRPPARASVRSPRPPASPRLSASRRPRWRRVRRPPCFRSCPPARPALGRAAQIRPSRPFTAGRAMAIALARSPARAGSRAPFFSFRPPYLALFPRRGTSARTRLARPRRVRDDMMGMRRHQAELNIGFRKLNSMLLKGRAWRPSSMRVTDGSPSRTAGIE